MDPSAENRVRSAQSDLSESLGAERSQWLAEEIQLHEPALRSYLRAQFPSIEADDVIQESYLKLLRIRAIDHIRSTKSYLFSIAHNTAVIFFRRHRLYSDIPVNELAEALVLDPTSDAGEAAHARQRMDLVVKMINRLPKRCREIMKLTALEGKSTAEIARQLKLSESTIRVQLARGVKRCARYLEEHHDER